MVPDVFPSCLSVCLPSYLSVFGSVGLRICLCVCLPSIVFIGFCVCLSSYLSACLLACVSATIFLPPSIPFPAVMRCDAMRCDAFFFFFFFVRPAASFPSLPLPSLPFPFRSGSICLSVCLSEEEEEERQERGREGGMRETGAEREGDERGRRDGRGMEMRGEGIWEGAGSVETRARKTRLIESQMDWCMDAWMHARMPEQAVLIWAMYMYMHNPTSATIYKCVGRSRRRVDPVRGRHAISHHTTHRCCARNDVVVRSFSDPSPLSPLLLLLCSLRPSLSIYPRPGNYMPLRGAIFFSFRLFFFLSFFLPSCSFSGSCSYSLCSTAQYSTTSSPLSSLLYTNSSPGLHPTFPQHHHPPPSHVPG